MKIPPMMNLMKDICAEIGAQIITYPKYEDPGIIVFKNGKRFFFTSNGFCINNYGSSGIATNKEYSSYFLSHFGYSTPKDCTFFSNEHCSKYYINENIDYGYEYAKQLSFPVMLKPSQLSQGKLITKVHNKREYYYAAKKIFKESYSMIVQEFYVGNDFRITVFDDNVVAAYMRIPLNIIGDGTSTISELIEMKQKHLISNSRKTIIDINDFRIINKLKQQKLSFDSIIENGKKIFLLDIANASSGGDVVDLSDSIHEDFIKLAINVTKDIGLRFCGVDIMTKDITSPLLNESYVVIEINAFPGLGNYSSIGKKQYDKVKEIYKSIVLSFEES